MQKVDEETYYTASDAIRFLQVSRWMFYKSLKSLVTPYEVGACKHPHYKQSELLEKVKSVRVKENV